MRPSGTRANEESGLGGSTSGKQPREELQQVCFVDDVGVLESGRDYRKKTLLMNREYSEETEHQKYRWIQSKGIFSDFDD